MDYRAKLHELLRLCSDNNEEAAKLILMDVITHSEEYHTVQNNAALADVFKNYYSLYALESLNVKELKERQKLLHETALICDKVMKCVHYGNGPELSEKEMPDFTNLESVIELKNRIVLTTKQKNFSNIKEEDAFSVFSDRTIKSAQECFDLLPVSVTTKGVISDTDISDFMKDTLYCVDIAQFDSILQNFTTFAQNSERIVSKERMRKRKHRLFKIATVMVCFGSIFSFYQFGLISEAYGTTFSGMMLIISLLYLIVG